MSSKTPSVSAPHGTAAWRLSALIALGFALGAGVAFFVAYTLVARGVRDRSDAWLRGEADLLAEVVATTPTSEMDQRLIEEVAELARHEVPSADLGAGIVEQPVFFLVTPADGGRELWAGPKNRTPFLDAIRKRRLNPGETSSIDVPGWTAAFRVDVHAGPHGQTIYLGLLDQAAVRSLREMKVLFTQLWLGMLAFGFAISWIGTKRILERVERITATAAGIGAGDLRRRVPGREGTDEIARLAQTFNGMLERIEASVEQIRAMGDAVAHDLRSPVTAIRGNLEMALTHGGEEELRESAAAALEGIDRLLALVNATLDVAEAEAGALRIHRRDVDLRELVDEMVELYRPALEERGLTPVVTGGPPARGSMDGDLVRRALGNLLDNAIRHLPPGRHVTLSAENRLGSLILEVRDDGPGFPRDLRDRAFERFAKGTTSTGSGIGLALVRAAALAHGGTAEILDAPGGGARVRLIFPPEPPSLAA